MQHEPAKINSSNIYQVDKEKILLKIIFELGIVITVILSWIAFKRYIHKEMNSFNSTLAKHINIIATCKYNIGAFKT